MKIHNVLFDKQILGEFDIWSKDLKEDSEYVLILEIRKMDNNIYITFHHVTKKLLESLSDMKNYSDIDKPMETMSIEDFTRIYPYLRCNINDKQVETYSWISNLMVNEKLNKSIKSLDDIKPAVDEFMEEEKTRNCQKHPDLLDGLCLPLEKFRLNEQNQGSLFLNTTKQSMDENFKILQERNATYGDNFEQIGNILSELFPEGKELKTKPDFSRFAMLTQIVLKLVRYSSNFSKGGHQDSLKDLINYAYILQFLDIKAKEK